MKNFFGPTFGPKGSNLVPRLGFFCHSLKFGSLVFLEIACNCNLQQCQLLVEVKPTKKFGSNRP